MRRKITFIISLILFQIFYLLSHYTVQYLNLFFLTDMSVRTCRLLQSVPAPDADFYRSENRSGT